MYGPFYTGYLKLDNVQYKQRKENDPRTPFFVDPEELSVLGRHKPLPYTLPEDSSLDQKFYLDMGKVRRQVNEYLSVIPELKRDKSYWLFFKVIAKYRNLTDLALDRDITDLYKEVTKENPSIPKNDAAYIKKSLEEIMTTTIPRFTAPIKEPKF